jgi:TldD protein
LKDLLTKINNTAIQKYGAKYAEARAQKLYKTSLTIKEERVEAAKQGIENGVAIRVLVNGAWGFASVGSFDNTILESAVSDACRMAKLASARLKTPIKLAVTKVVSDRVLSKPKKNPVDIQMEDKIKTALAVNKASLGLDKRIKSCSLDYFDLTARVILLIVKEQVLSRINCMFGKNNCFSSESGHLYIWS